MDELIDLVNESDEVVGSIMKDEAHEKGIGHRIVVAFIFDEKGRVLIQKRTKEKGGFFDISIGGHVRAGESYDDSVQRELKEEFGLDIPLGFVGKFEIKDATALAEGKEQVDFFAVYEAYLTAEEVSSIEPQADEVESVIPMTISEVKEAIRLNPRDWGRSMPEIVSSYMKKRGIEL